MDVYIRSGVKARILTSIHVNSMFEGIDVQELLLVQWALSTVKVFIQSLVIHVYPNKYSNKLWNYTENVQKFYNHMYASYLYILFFCITVMHLICYLW